MKTMGVFTGMCLIKYSNLQYWTDLNSVYNVALELHDRFKWILYFIMSKLLFLADVCVYEK